MNENTQPKTMSVLDKIRNKIASDILAAQQPKSVRHALPSQPFPKKPRPEHPKYITFPTFFRTFAHVALPTYDTFVNFTHGSHWNLDKIVFPEDHIRIEVPSYLKSNGEPFPNFIDLKSNFDSSFRSGILFYKIHKALVETTVPHERNRLRGAKLTANPNQLTLDEDEPRIYGFYTNDEWAKCEPARRWLCPY